MTDAGKKAVGDFISFMNSVDIPPLEAGVKWNDAGSAEFISRFNTMAKAANMTAEQVQSAVKEMGFDAEIVY
jgi:hypothetical protein